VNTGNRNKTNSIKSIFKHYNAASTQVARNNFNKNIINLLDL
jgi:hypothetical protein